MFLKDPNATLDYVINWTSWLAGDTIASSAHTVPTGLTLVSESETTTHTTVWVSGGTAGQKYEIICRITTAAGRIEDRTIELKIVER